MLFHLTSITNSSPGSVILNNQLPLLNSSHVYSSKPIVTKTWSGFVFACGVIIMLTMFASSISFQKVNPLKVISLPSTLVVKPSTVGVLIVPLNCA